MALVARFRAWRTRRKAQKDEQLIALGAVSAKDSADAKRVRDDLEKRLQTEGGYDAPWTQHAGDEGKTHY